MSRKIYMHVNLVRKFQKLQTTLLTFQEQQGSQENICAKVSLLIKLQASSLVYRKYIFLKFQKVS